MSEIEIRILLDEASKKVDDKPEKSSVKPDKDIEVCLNEIIQTNDITQAHTLANEVLQLVKKQKDSNYKTEDIVEPAGLKDFIDSKFGKSEDDKKKEGE
jgi:hypothetical protein